MPHQLRVIAGRDSGRVFALPEQRAVLVGRDMGAPARLKDPQVAMQHCRVTADGDGALLADGGGAGGTFVAGQRVREHRLRPGDVFRVGDTQVRFE